MCHCVVVSRWLHPTQGDRRPSRSVGAITLLVFGGTAAAAVVLAVLFHLGVAPTVITVLVGGGAPAGVYLAYATYRLNADQASSAVPISTHPPTALAPDGGPSPSPGDDSSGDQNGGQGTENNDLRAAAAITDSDKQVSAVLRLLDRASGADHRVMISWQPPESASMEATAEFTYQIDKADAERIRWYLEDFAEFPDDSSFRLAADTEDRMSAIGRELFARYLRRGNRLESGPLRHQRPVAWRGFVSRWMPTLPMCLDFHGILTRPSDGPAGSASDTGVRSHSPSGR